MKTNLEIKKRKCEKVLNLKQKVENLQKLDDCISSIEFRKRLSSIRMNYCN